MVLAPPSGATGAVSWRVGGATTLWVANPGSSAPCAVTPSLSPGAKRVPGEVYRYVPTLSGVSWNPAPKTPPVTVRAPGLGAVGAPPSTAVLASPLEPPSLAGGGGQMVVLHAPASTS